jgi:hypothetical protein
MKLSGRLQKQHLMHRGFPIIAHPASASFRHRLDRGLCGGLATAGWRQVPAFKRRVQVRLRRNASGRAGQGFPALGEFSGPAEVVSPFEHCRLSLHRL